MANMVRTLVAFAWLLLYSNAQTQSYWIFPSLPDLHQSLTVGDTVKIQWGVDLGSLVAGSLPGATASDVDLWITDFNLDLFERRIATGVDISTAGSYEWTVRVPLHELKVTDEWVFRLVAPGSPGEDTPGIPSPAFKVIDTNPANITNAAQPLVTTSSSSSSPLSSPAVESISTSLLAPPTTASAAPTLPTTPAETTPRITSGSRPSTDISVSLTSSTASVSSGTNASASSGTGMSSSNKLSTSPILRFAIFVVAGACFL